MSAAEGWRSVVYPVDDIAASTRFCDYLLRSLDAAGAPALRPGETIVATSTPPLVEAFTGLGFAIEPLELGSSGVWKTPRAWQVLERIVSDDGLSEPVRDLMHPACLELWERYRLDRAVIDVHRDPAGTEDGELTRTRDYTTYADAFDRAADRKWAEIARHVVPGRIVDIGCGPGSLLQRAADDPHLHESDLYGIELARPLYEECLHRRRQGWFGNPNVFFYQRNVLRDPVFEDRSIDSTVTVALTHEIRSYLGADALRLLAERIYRHTRPGGVWINVDVAGPRDGDDGVWLTLDPPTTTRFASFARDFRAEEGEAPWPYAIVSEQRAGTTFEVTRRLAMEFLAKKDYTDNWQSEMHERFCDLDLEAWQELLADAGFSVSPASTATTNRWLVEHRFAPVARLDAPGQPSTPLPWPDTHVLLVATRPLAS